MAEIVGVFAASHTPVMLNFPDQIQPAELAAVRTAFTELGRRIGRSRPQALVVVSDDHLHNFFLDNLPAFAIGAGNAWPTPVESWLKASKRVLPGDPALGAHLLGEAMEAGFDPALTMQLTLDHGTLTPLELAGVPADIPIVPVLVNCTQPPLPTMKRCLQFGRFIGAALRSYPKLDRIAVLATGGLSHDVGTPRMGLVNETFDRRFLQLLAEGNEAPLLQYSVDHVDEAGNGAEEIRMWLVAHAIACPGSNFDVIHYQALQAWYAGIGVVEWRGVG